MRQPLQLRPSISYLTLSICVVDCQGKQYQRSSSPLLCCLVNPRSETEKVKSRKLIWLNHCWTFEFVVKWTSMLFCFDFFNYELMAWKKRKKRICFLFINLDKMGFDFEYLGLLGFDLDYLGLIIGTGDLGIIFVDVDKDLQGKFDSMKASNSTPVADHNENRVKRADFYENTRTKPQILRNNLMGRKWLILLLRRL
ncbi:unnamed protein product [Lactuca virosa]|uniref:Uncharacterized protein n=1 Tax=Lactuca virosa TaxID=75947 RepID=A0AAU9N218_9ASTR|nr:unnamed protein product [Lactuca virosa]